MFTFIKVSFSGSLQGQGYQVIDNGRVIKRVNLDGDLLDDSLPFEEMVIDPEPTRPVWADMLPEPPPIEPYIEWPTWATADFLNRFTQQEYGTICTLASNASAVSPLVFGLIAKLNAHPLVYAANPELNAGLAELVNLGVFTAERKKEILGGYEP